MKKSLIAAGVLAILAGASSLAQEHKGGMAASESTSITATVEKIDAANRVLTLKGPEGNVVDVEVSPAVKRFDAIKVGDKLTVKYTESMVITVKKADSSAPLGVSYEQAAQPHPGEKPSGVIARRVQATVAVEKTDVKGSSITVRTSDGNVESFHVQDPKRLEGVNPGDKITITYDEAVAITVEAPKS